MNEQKAKPTKRRCPTCKRILTKLYRRDTSKSPFKATEYLECRTCKKAYQ